MAPSGVPLVQTLTADVDPQGTANTAQSRVIGEVSTNATVVSVSITPVAAVTAHATNYRTFAVVNKGQDGSGTTSIATFATDTVSTDDLAAFDEKALTLTGTAADLNVAEGDILAAVETVAASGVAHGGYTVKVELKRR